MLRNEWFSSISGTLEMHSVFMQLVWPNRHY